MSAQKSNQDSPLKDQTIPSVTSFNSTVNFTLFQLANATRKGNDDLIAQLRKQDMLLKSMDYS